MIYLIYNPNIKEQINIKNLLEDMSLARIITSDSKIQKPKLIHENQEYTDSHIIKTYLSKLYEELSISHSCKCEHFD